MAGSIVIVGGGIAGLAAAVELARAGAKVALFEQASAFGGRARTKEIDGFHLNQGPHALYINGAFMRTLDRLGVAYAGGRALGGTRQAIWRGRLHDLPASTRTLITTSLFGLRDKIAFARAFATLRQDAAREGSFADWLDAQQLSPTLRAALEALGRLSSYANGSSVVSAAAMLDQIRLGLGGTLYLDGGWGSVVEGLARAARDAGAELNAGCAVDRVAADGAGVELRLADGRVRRADAAILATPPDAAAALAPWSAALAQAAREATPVRANTLDLALARMPKSARDFALGIDAPYYLSLHSSSAKLAPAGGAVVHVAKYLPIGEGPARDAIPELERVADLVMPGWRAFEVKRQELRGMVVSHGLPRWDRARPAVTLADAPGLFIAGDWVGDEGMIADAAAASGLAAARAALAAVAAPKATTGAA